MQLCKLRTHMHTIRLRFSVVRPLIETYLSALKTAHNLFIVINENKYEKITDEIIKRKTGT